VNDYERAAFVPAPAEPLRRLRVAVLMNSAVVSLLLAAIGCDDRTPPPYVRAAGPTPVLVDVPNGRAFLVSFWASWCAPCREETPDLVRLAEDPPGGLHVVVISEDASIEDVFAFFGGVPPRRLNLRLDEESSLMRAFGVEQLPVSFLVVDGRLVASFRGRRDWDSRGMRRLLIRLVGEAQSADPAQTAG
jgi:cytochrome c biogenesis protein CcmG/thiol:disulfide interchange protein DsbE